MAGLISAQKEIAERFDDLAVVKHPSGSDRFYTILDRRTGKYIRLGATEFALLSVLASGTDVAEIPSLMKKRHSVELNLDDVGQFLAKMKTVLISQPQRRGRLASLASIRIGTFHGARIGDVAGNVFAILFRTPVLIALTALIATALLVAFWSFSEILSEIAHAETLTFLVVSYSLLAITQVIHEISHAGALHCFGGRIRGFGLLVMYLFVLGFYTDVTDAWRLERKDARMGVSLAGPLSTAIIFSVCVFTWRFSQQGFLRQFALSGVYVTLLVLLFCVNPFMRTDMYYTVCDLLDYPNLWRRALNEVRLRLKIGGDPALQARTRNRSLLFLYGIGILTIGPAIALVALFSFFQVVASWWRL